MAGKFYNVIPSIDYSEFLDALSELLDKKSFQEIISFKDEPKTQKDVKYIIESLKRHPDSMLVAKSLENVNINSKLEEIYSEILGILRENDKVSRLFRRLWSYFFPILQVNKRRSVSDVSHSQSTVELQNYKRPRVSSDIGISPKPHLEKRTNSQTKTTLTPKTTTHKIKPATGLYESRRGVMDGKSQMLLESLDQALQETEVRGQMLYILRSLKNHSDSNILFYYRIRDQMNLLDVVNKFQNGEYSLENSENLKLDVESVFERFCSEFPNDENCLRRAQYHFDHLWNYFFPNLSSRTRRKKIL